MRGVGDSSLASPEFRLLMVGPEMNMAMTDTDFSPGEPQLPTQTGRCLVVVWYHSKERKVCEEEIIQNKLVFFPKRW